MYGAIFNNQTYGYGHGLTPQDYTAGHTGNPTQDHQDHVHAWYKPGGQDNISPLTGGPASSGPVPVTVVNPTDIGPIGTDQASIAKAIFSAFTGAGYSPQSAMTAVQAGLLESGLNPAARNSSGHNSIFQTSADKGVGSDPASQIRWALNEAGRFGGPAAMNPDPANFWANNIERGGYPGSMYADFAPRATQLLSTPGSLGIPAMPGGPIANGMPQAAPFGGPSGISPASFGNPFAGQQGPGVAPGISYPSQGGNTGNIAGGLPLDAAMGAASALDAMMPGAGAAAKIGIQLMNRTAGYVAQNAGILASGALETLSVGDNPKGSLGAGWLGKVIGGLAGAAPALPNIAGGGGKKPPGPMQQAGGGQTQTNNVDNSQTNITLQPPKGTSAETQASMVAEQTRMYAPPGRQ